METIQQTLLHTPWWVYVIFIWIIYRCIKNFRMQVIRVSRIFIIPGLLVIFALHTMLTLTTWTTPIAMIMLLSIIIGIILGWFNNSLRNVKVDRTHRLVQVEGSWFTIVLLLVIFASKYYIGYLNATAPEMLQNPTLIYIIYVINGISAGILVGRVFHYLRTYYTQESIDLSHALAKKTKKHSLR